MGRKHKAAQAPGGGGFTLSYKPGRYENSEDAGLAREAFLVGPHYSRALCAKSVWTNSPIRTPSKYSGKDILTSHPQPNWMKPSRRGIPGDADREGN